MLPASPPRAQRGCLPRSSSPRLSKAPPESHAPKGQPRAELLGGAEADLVEKGGKKSKGRWEGAGREQPFGDQS